MRFKNADVASVETSVTEQSEIYNGWLSVLRLYRVRTSLDESSGTRKECAETPTTLSGRS